MNIAMLSKRICFEKNETVTDAIGNHMSHWKDYYSCMATVSGEGGSEVTDAGTTENRSDASFTVRWCGKIAVVTTTGFRIRFGQDTYNILSVDHFSYDRKAVKFRCQKERNVHGEESSTG
jgi:SPP1 family predicted phage head-tail adaptor